MKTTQVQRGELVFKLEVVSSTLADVVIERIDGTLVERRQFVGARRPGVGDVGLDEGDRPGGEERRMKYILTEDDSIAYLCGGWDPGRRRICLAGPGHTAD